MAARTKEVGIRLSVKDKEVVERALRQVGADGEAALKRIERAGKPASVSLQALNAAANGARSAFGGFVTGAGSALLASVSLAAAINTAKAGLQEFGDIADKSAAAGVDSEFFQGIAYQAKMAGVELDTTAGALATFAKNSGLAAEGKGRMLGALQALNPELLKNIQLATSQEQRIKLVADALNKETDASRKAAIAAAAFGDAGTALVAAFKGGAAEIDRMLASAKEMGLIVSRDLIARADEMGDKFDTVSQILDLKIKTAMINLAPYLNGLVGAAADWGNMLAIVLDHFQSIENRQFLRPLQNELADVYQKRDDVQQGMQDLKTEIDSLGSSGSVGMLNEQLKGMQEEFDTLTAKATELLNRIQELQGYKPPTAPGPAPDPNAGMLGRGGPGRIKLAEPFYTPGGKKTGSRNDAADTALKEAEALIKRLQTASESYAETVADLTEKHKAGLINQETFNRGLAAAAVTFAGAADGTDEYAEALARLDEAKAKGIVTEQQYTEAVEALTKKRLLAQNDWLSGVQLGLMNLKSGADDITSSVASAVESWATSLGDGIGEVFRTGKFEWKDLVNTILADIAKIATQQLITKPLSALLGSLFGGIGGGLTPQPATGYGFGIPLAEGGPVTPGAIHLVGERGPELFMSRGPGTVIPNHKLGGANVSMTLNANYNVDGSNLSQGQLQAVLENHSKTLLEAVPGVVKKAMARGSFG